MQASLYSSNSRIHIRIFYSLYSKGGRECGNAQKHWNSYYKKSGENLTKAKRNHFIVLVTYLNKIEDDISPECYIIPSTFIERIAVKTKKGYLITIRA
jgi:hypothetical protein